MVSNSGKRANGVHVSRFFRVILARKQCIILASAYEVEEARVEQDATIICDWGGTEAELLAVLEARHSWTVGSEYALY